VETAIFTGRTDVDGTVSSYYRQPVGSNIVSHIRFTAGSAFFDLTAYAIAISATDSDGDLMPDAWETLYSLDPYTNGSGLDSDGDGVYDVLEFFQGRNPTKGAVPDTNEDIKLKLYLPEN
jgi:hypothetical protein